MTDFDANSTARQPRKSWDEYFIDIATMVATRATCDRLHVGCVLVDPRTKAILSTGYNGSVPGTPHCDDEGHDMVEGHCVRTNHAEQNAICQAAKHGARLDGATAYITAYPCWLCAKQLLVAGVKRIVYGKAYRVDPRVVEACLETRCTIESVAASSGE